MKRFALVALFASVAFLFPLLAAAQEQKPMAIRLSDETNPQREKERLQMLASLQGVSCAPAARTDETAAEAQSIELRFSEAAREAAAVELKNPGREAVAISVTVPDAAGAQSVSFSICPQATAVLDLGRLVAREQDRLWVKLRGDVAATVVVRDPAGSEPKQRFNVATDFEVNRLLIFAGPEDRYQLESEVQPAAVESNFKLRDGSSAQSVREEASALSVLEPPSDAQSGVVRLAFGRRLRGGQNR